MKKVFLPVTALLLMLASVAQAQTERGHYFLSLHNFSSAVPQANGFLAPTNALGIGFGTFKTEANAVTLENSYMTLGLSGSGHYFLADNFSVGINLNFSYQKEKEKSTGNADSYSATLLMGGPELRYYIPISAKTKVWINGSGSFGSVRPSEADENPTRLRRFGGGAGLAIFPFERFSVDVGLGYGLFLMKENYKDLNGNTREFTNKNAGFAADLGFSIFF